jgi:hypothetical protein
MIRELTINEVDEVSGDDVGGLVMGIAGGWASTVSGFGTAALVGGVRGGLVGGAVGFGVGVAIGVGYYFAA